MRLLKLLVVLAAVLACAAPSFAQYGRNNTATPMKNWNVRTGAFFPTGDYLDTAFTIGIEYGYPATGIFKGAPGQLSISADYVGIHQNLPFFIHEKEDVSLFPVFVNWKYSTAMTRPGTSLDYGLGVGAYFADHDILAMHMNDTAQFAYTASIGYHFTPAWFVEGRYMASEHPSDDGLWGAEIGYSF